MKRVLAFVYGAACYGLFLAIFPYSIGFMGGFGVPTQLDGPLEGSLASAISINLLLLTVFALQHSVMARPAFKKILTRFVPEPIERSTYVLFSCLAMILLFWQWRPMGGEIWHIQSTAGQVVLYTMFGLGWVTIFCTTFLINHFDLFGLRQVYLYLRGKPYQALPFKTPGPYRLVRHPLYVGWIMTFWFTPYMTAAHLLFALGCTAYILVAIVFEERDLVDALGKDYEDYRQRTPKLVPIMVRSGR